MSNNSISQQEYEVFRGFLEKSCGIVLGDNRHYLVTSRLGRLMSECGFSSFKVLTDQAYNDSNLRNQILDAMTTNETSWFRDNYPYEQLKLEIFPSLAKQKNGPIRIWSAACSAGQEPYSISMVLQEFKQGHPGLLNNLTEIIATDISKTILEQAEKGAYDGVSLVRGLSDERKNKYFKPLPDEAKWQVNKEIREIVTFKSFNLMSNFTAFGKFDAIFCRNVLIYFSEDLKKDILSRMIKVLNPGGYLLLGGSESFSGYSDFFDIIRVKSGAIYKLK